MWSTENHCGLRMGHGGGDHDAIFSGYNFTTIMFFSHVSFASPSPQGENMNTYHLNLIR
jgi:hypothetical protein